MNFSFSQEISEDLKKKIDFIYELSSINLNQALVESYKLEGKFEHYDSFNQVSIYLLIIDLQIMNSEYNKAIKYCEKALEISEKNNFDRYSLNIYYYMSIAYDNLNQIENALAIYNNLSTEMDKTDLSYIYNLMQIDFGLLNKKFGNNKKALSIFDALLRDSNEIFNGDVEHHEILLLNLADLYNKLENSDSSQVYLEKFEKLHLENPETANYYSLKVKGDIAFDNQEYNAAIDYYSECLAILKESYDYNDLEVILKKSQSFFYLNNLDSTIYYRNHLINEENFSNRLSAKDLMDFYELNSEIFKSQNKTEEGDFYYKKYLSAKEDFNKLKFKTQEGLNEIKTKEIIAEGKQTEKKYKSYIAFISSILGFLLAAGLMLYVFNYTKNKKKFAQLMATVQKYEERKSIEPVNKTVSIVEELPRNIEKELVKKEEAKKQPVEIVEEKEAEKIEQQSSSTTSTIVDDSTSPIKDEKIQELLDKLDKLKDSGYFLRQDSSLYNTAKKLKTNTSYLSSVINNTMDTNFNRFVNDIRMDYIILELKNSKRMRSYSVKGIAEEIGYKSADSFSKYFKESTGLTPSAYVRNLNKEFKV
ncbi:helix-turn-helix domain-containing protein [Zobellia nedashkovskayae]|uniref:helix-turn-helix domain-containing protein n=1 Tax=Zobellia nedashkovskayae TaxID=2779510 RepID=UPI00188D9112|nr:helix-turn-helix domain-containing protein [Zobellia nedashkovskayae]